MTMWRGACMMMSCRCLGVMANAGSSFLPNTIAYGLSKVIYIYNYVTSLREHVLTPPRPDGTHESRTALQSLDGTKSPCSASRFEHRLESSMASSRMAFMIQFFLCHGAGRTEAWPGTAWGCVARGVYWEIPSRILS